MYQKFFFPVLFLFSFFSLNTVNGQCPTSLTLSTQAEIDSFPINYPNCTEIPGDVLLGILGFPVFSFIDNVDSLYSIQKIGGNLTISYYRNESFTGFQDLIEVGDDLSLYRADSISDFNGFDNLSKIGGTLNVNRSKIETCSGLPSLLSVGGLYFKDNDYLSDFYGLPLVDSLQQFRIEGNRGPLNDFQSLPKYTQIDEVVISGNDSLKSTVGFDSLKSAVSIRISDNAMLNSITGFNHLTDVRNMSIIDHNNLQTIKAFPLAAIHGFLYIQDNRNLKSIEDIGSATSIQKAGHIYTISDNISLEYISAFDNVNKLYNLKIESNHSLYAINGFLQLRSMNRLVLDNLKRLQELTFLHTVDSIPNIQLNRLDSLKDLNDFQNIKGTKIAIITANKALNNLSGLNSLDGNIDRVYIEDNPNLISLEGFSSVDSIGILEIQGNESLLSFQGFENIQVGSLTVENNESLTSFQGLNHIKELSSLSVINNTSLMDLSGFDSLTHVVGALAIEENPNLETLNGLNQLETIGGNLDVYINNNLKDLDGLSSLSTVDQFWLRRNTILTDISGASSLTNANLLYISSNDSLSTCAFPYVCALALEDKVQVHSNKFGGGCRTENQLLDSCSSVTLPCPSSVIFNSQTKVDIFSSIYQGCTSFQGDVVVEGSSIKKLDSLYLIDSIGGDLIIRNSDDLISLEGLKNIKTVAGNLIIENLSDLISIDSAFQNLYSIGGDLILKNSTNISDISGFKNIKSIGGDFNVSQMDNLTKLNSFDSLQTIDGTLNLYLNKALNQVNYFPNLSTLKGLQITQNESIAQIQGFDQLDSVEHGITFDLNDGLIEIDALNNLEQTAFLKFENNPILEQINEYSQLTSLNNLSVRFCESLPQLPVFTQLDSIKGTLNISDNALLLNLSGLDSLRYSFHISIDSNYLLSNLVGLGNLQYVDNELFINGNNQLLSLQGLEKLDSVGGHLNIRQNQMLSDVAGIEYLQKLGGLLIDFNESIINVNGLNDNLKINDFASIRYNPNLSFCNEPSICHYLQNHAQISADFEGNDIGCNYQELLDSCMIMPCPPPMNWTFASQQEVDSFGALFSHCSTIDGSVTISGQDIVNLNGLSGITSITGDLIIENNDLLTESNQTLNLAGLSTLTSIGGKLIIKNNAVLTNLSTFANLNYIGDSLIISDNPLLNSCVSTFVCDYMNQPNATYSILGNGTMCNQAYLESLCASSTQESKNSFYMLYPNPSIEGQSVRIAFNNIVAQKIKVYDLVGQLRFSKELDVQSGEVAIPFLESGTYILLFQTNSKTFVEKIIVH